MRWICKGDVEESLTEDWRKEAEAALKTLCAAKTSDERKKILKRKSSSDVWRDYYALLPENLKKKCWYCEAEEIRSDMPVDHFRPKNKVYEADDHDGYWWLAFDWENYRCACTYCNSYRISDETQGGKQDKFPLFPDCVRAECPEDDVKQEHPALLDPFEPDDHKLLWFDADGKPEPSVRCSADDSQKVKNSISIFHLHEKKITRQRNRLRLEIEGEVRELREAVQEGANGRVAALKAKLRKRVRDTEMLSRAAVVYLSNHRDMPEVQDILNLD